jgi:cysteine desulfurase
MKDVSCSTDTIIYADNAATTRMLDEVIDIMITYCQHYYGNPSSRHIAAKKPNQALADSRRIIADCINCDESEIFFTSGGTESDNWALEGILKTTQKNHIIISCIEHPAVIEKCNQLEKEGYKITKIKVDSKGSIDLDELKAKIDDNTALVSIMHVNNEIGTIQDLKQISEIVHNKEAIFHTDAVQSLGHIQIDVQEMGIDLLSGSAHKFNGPKGIGFLYCKKTIPLKPLILGGHQQNNKRAGTENVPNIVGMALALKNNCEMMKDNTNKITKMEKIIIDILSKSNLDYKINGRKESKIPGILNISFKDISGEALVDILSMKKICISTGSACNSKTTEISHVLEALDINQNYINGTIRISLGRFNSEQESTIIGNDLVDIVKKLIVKK